MNITDKCGEYSTISHDLDSTSIMVDIQGKTASDGGIHQRYCGLASHQAGWTKTCGGTNDDGARPMVQTGDGGYALAGYTSSFGAGSFDFHLVKTDVEQGLAWTDSTANALTLYRGATDRTGALSE